jgi:hypothetical protein
LNVIIPLVGPPDDGMNVTHAVAEAPGASVAEKLPENAGFEDESDATLSVASPVFETVKQNDDDDPTFTTP